MPEHIKKDASVDLDCLSEKLPQITLEFD